MKGSDTVKNASTTSVPQGVASRYAGVLRSPRVTLGRVAREPRWVGMLAFLVALVAGSSFAFLSTESGQSAALDAAVRQLENFGVTVDDALYGWLTDQLPTYRWLALAGSMLGLPALALGASATVFAAFRAAGHSTVRFVQLLAIVVHSGVVLSLQRVVALPLNYVNESLSVPTNLGAMLPMIEESSMLAGFLGGIDLFAVWWLMVLAIGLAALYPHPARRIALRLIGGYMLVAFALAVTVTTLRTS